MNNIPHTDINTLGEFGLIDLLTKDLPKYHQETILGVGDDAAIIDVGGYFQLISTDSLVEGIHFDLSYTPLNHLGYKAVVANLSDIYAMNGIPKQIVVSLALSNRFSIEALEQLYVGIKKACELYHVDLIGGDTTSSLKGLFVNITAIGTVEKNQVVTRRGAKPGDLICVTGDLGGAYLGLQILEREKQLFDKDPSIQPDLEGESYVVRRQLKPEARKDAIEYFRKKNLLPTAMIDISDGLSSELMHICKQSGVGAYIEEDKIPIHNDCKLLALKFGLDPITPALNGGEEYELLFCVDPLDIEKVKYMPDVYILGEVVEANLGLTLHATDGKIHSLQSQGWKHF